MSSQHQGSFQETPTLSKSAPDAPSLRPPFGWRREDSRRIGSGFGVGRSSSNSKVPSLGSFLTAGNRFLISWVHKPEKGPKLQKTLKNRPTFLVATGKEKDILKFKVNKKLKEPSGVRFKAPAAARLHHSIDINLRQLASLGSLGNLELRPHSIDINFRSSKSLIK